MLLVHRHVDVVDLNGQHSVAHVVGRRSPVHGVRRALVGREVDHAVQNGVRAHKAAVGPIASIGSAMADVGPRPRDAVGVADHVATSHAELRTRRLLEKDNVRSKHTTGRTWCGQVKLVPRDAMVVGIRHLAIVSCAGQLKR